MGLFLQKTNIIRDYREDLDDKRKFWPRQIWSKYADDLGDFADPKNLDAVLLHPHKPNTHDSGSQLYFRNDAGVIDSCCRVSNIPLRPPRPIRLQLLRHPAGHGHRDLGPRIP
jgi:Squalene/phytoene synthase